MEAESTRSSTESRRMGASFFSLLAVGEIVLIVAVVESAQRQADGSRRKTGAAVGRVCFQRSHLRPPFFVLAW